MRARAGGSISEVGGPRSACPCLRADLSVFLKSIRNHFGRQAPEPSPSLIPEAKAEGQTSEVGGRMAGSESTGEPIEESRACAVSMGSLHLGPLARLSPFDQDLVRAEAYRGKKQYRTPNVECRMSKWTEPSGKAFSVRSRPCQGLREC